MAKEALELTKLTRARLQIIGVRELYNGSGDDGSMTEEEQQMDSEIQNLALQN